MVSPYSRSKQMLESQGYAVGRCEHWNSFSHIRQDLYGIIDMLAVKDSILGVQVTSGDKAHEHLVKALGNAVIPLWLRSGGRFEIHAWRKVNDHGRKRAKWAPRVISLRWNGKKIVIDELGPEPLIP